VWSWRNGGRVRKTARTQILECLATFPDGVTVDDVRAHFDNVPTRECIRKWLRKLVQEGKVARIEPPQETGIAGWYALGPLKRGRYRLGREEAGRDGG
jgi:hypothetical protein